MSEKSALWRRLLTAIADTSPAFTRNSVDYRGRGVLSAIADSTPAFQSDSVADAYSVDRAPHQENFTVSIPSQEEVFTFSAKVRATWHVTDPIAAIRIHANPPGLEVRHYLERRLRDFSRNFKPENSSDAEQGINLELGNRQIQVSDSIIITHCDVALALDEATAAHVASWTLAARERERLDQLRQTEIVRHELEKERAEHRHQLEAMKEHYELALKKERVEFYAEALQSGSHHLLALRLAGHGDDVNDVIQLIMRQEEMEFTRATEILKMLLANTLVNNADVAEVLRNVNPMADYVLPPPRVIEAVRVDNNDEDDGNEHVTDRSPT